jgi:hypothetical protein
MTQRCSISNPRNRAAGPGSRTARRLAILAALTVALCVPHTVAAQVPTQAEAAGQLAAASPVALGATDDATADFAVAPLVTPPVHEFVESKSDFRRSSLLAFIIVPLLVVLLVERELFVARGRAGARVILAYGLVLVAGFAMLVLVRLREYLG